MTFPPNLGRRDAEGGRCEAEETTSPGMSRPSPGAGVAPRLIVLLCEMGITPTSQG